MATPRRHHVTYSREENIAKLIALYSCVARDELLLASGSDGARWSRRAGGQIDEEPERCKKMSIGMKPTRAALLTCPQSTRSPSCDAASARPYDSS